MTTTDAGLTPAVSSVDGERLTAPQSEPPRPSRRSRRRPSGGFTPYALLVPASIVLAAIVGWPLIQLLVTSMQEFGRAQVFGAPPSFVWFENYVDVLTDVSFYEVLGRSLVFAAGCVVVTMVLGTLIALLLTRLPKAFRLLLSIGLLLAWAMPPLSATIVWGWMFDTDYGVVNHVLVNTFGLEQFTQHSWLIDPLSFFLVAGIIIVPEDDEATEEQMAEKLRRALRGECPYAAPERQPGEDPEEPPDDDREPPDDAPLGVRTGDQP